MGSRAQMSFHRGHLGVLMRAEKADPEHQDWKRLSGEKECRLLPLVIFAVVPTEFLKRKHGR